MKSVLRLLILTIITTCSLQALQVSNTPDGELMRELDQAVTNVKSELARYFSCNPTLCAMAQQYAVQIIVASPLNDLPDTQDLVRHVLARYGTYPVPDPFSPACCDEMPQSNDGPYKALGITTW